MRKKIGVIGYVGLECSTLANKIAIELSDVNINSAVIGVEHVVKEKKIKLISEQFILPEETKYFEKQGSKYHK
ncbi:hypothetical protein Phi19:1_gp049 [Cellulophaga phage phi19:1]|uniref:Uncharacterized protein n=1 Tax=Cellulophaga phage phi19:1 TaxID=1327970 RepID=R9ZVW6_9CAUD|nr:hypothetical protein Phi19:1_gp049 [Cellulophaga phage phi19:1]AGO47339.1 hypothetical protein Phi19:1_gp049 [Cellulophaga phage phi19:1]